MSPTSRSRTLVTALVLALGAPFLSGCEDNISCVFTTGCAGNGSAGSLGAEASLPVDGVWIEDSRPTITDVFPNGGSATQTTPIVVVFSESMSLESLEGLVELVPDVGGFPGMPIPGLPQTLTGDGRVLVILPPTLELGDYSVQLSADNVATDITGQALDATTGFAIADFGVVEGMMGDPPQVLATWPLDLAQNQSDTSEIVAIFDRPISPVSVTSDSFQVLIDGVDPVDDPTPQPLQIGFMGATTPDTRGFVYRSADPAGNFTPLGSGVNMQVLLSQAGTPIISTENEILAPFSFTFVTTPFASPLSAAILSTPTDAIGIPNLTAGDPEELLIQVELLDGEPGDTLDLFMFGTGISNDPTMPAPLIAFRRDITLAGVAPVMTAQFTLSEIDILSSSSPSSARFADDPVSFAFRLRRSGAISTLRVLDADPLTLDVQDPILDTTGPTVTELLFPGGRTDLFVSDLRDLTLVGVADESLRAVEVTTPMGNNGTLPPVVGSSGDGLFVAAPVDVDVLGGGTLDYTLVAYDSAFNPSQPITGTFTQRGAVQSGGFSPGDQVTIEVFDALTLEPLENALVTLHADMGDGVNFPLAQAGFTLADGTIPLNSAGAPSVGAILTVDLMDYDLFSFFDITSTDISVPLMPLGASASALVNGTVASADPLVTLLLPFLTSKLDDSRRPFGVAGTYNAGMCSGTGVISCPYGPEPVRPALLGAQSFLAGDFMLSEVAFNPVQLLQAFCLDIPIAPTMGPLQGTAVQLPFMLNDPGIAPEEVPVELFPGTQVTFRADATNEIDLMFLEPDPTTLGDPRITVEALVPGVHGSVTVGMGLAYDQGAGDTWTVRAAVPGAVTPGGFFGMNGSVDSDPFIRFELRDALGRVAGARVRESELPNLLVPNTPFATSPSVLQSPAEFSTTSGASYNVDFDDVIPDAGGQAGLYSIQLLGDAVRRWTIWTPDPPGSGTVSVHLPDIESIGGDPLPSGEVLCLIGAFAWPSLDPQEFLWTDVEREHDLFSFSRVFTFDQP